MDSDAGHVPTNPETLAANRGPHRPLQTQWPHAKKRARAVGSVVHFRRPTETFHEFLLWMVKWAVGKEWYLAEVAKPHEERHQLVKWFWDVQEWQKKVWHTADRRGYMRGATPSGATQALTAVGYDLYTLSHAMCLPDRLITRLKDRHEFQGASYEIAVAALVVRAGFKVKFTDENDEAPHCEFIASRGDVLFGVEAKSRRRRGVLHEPGNVDEAKVIRGDVQALFEKAVTQAPEGLPFVIFIDLNCPPLHETSGAAIPARATWWNDVVAVIQTYFEILKGDETKRARFNELVITNFATHYFGRDTTPTTGERFIYHPMNPLYGMDGRAINALRDGVRRYGSFPLDPD